MPADRELLALRPRVLLQPRGMGLGAVALLSAVAGALVLGSPASAVDAALERVKDADPIPIAATVLVEAGSFCGYVLLTWLVLGRAAPRITFAVSAQVTLAGAAITRVLPTAGLGGVGLTLWALRRAGRTSVEATSALLTFLVLTYAVFLAALTAAGILVLAGAAGDAPAWIGIGPVSFGVTAFAAAARIALRTPVAPGSAETRPRRRRLVQGASALRTSMGRARTELGSRDARLLGAAAWWGLDLTVLLLAFAALGNTPAIAIVAVGYFAGIVANTIPVPGAVSGGMTGVLVLCGLPIDLVVPAVLLYRGISLWLPVPAGLAALVALQRNVHRWPREDHRERPSTGPGSRIATTRTRPPARTARRHPTAPGDAR